MSMQKKSCLKRDRNIISAVAGSTDINRNSPSPISMYSVQIQRLFLDLVRVLQDALGFQSPSGLFKSPCLYTMAIVSISVVKCRDPNMKGEGLCRGKSLHVRSIRLENVCDTSDQEASDEAIVPDVFPAFLHVFLTGLDTEQPAGGGIVVVAVISSTEAGSG